MGFFDRKKKETEVVKDTFVQKLSVIDMQLVELATKALEEKDKSVQFIHLAGSSNPLDDNANCFAVMGNPESLINMLQSAGLKEPSFAKMLITAAERLVSKSNKLSNFQDEIKRDEDCMCENCQMERAMIDQGVKSMESLSIEEIAKMSPEKMDELVKKIVKSSKQG